MPRTQLGTSSEPQRRVYERKVDTANSEVGQSISGEKDKDKSGITPYFSLAEVHGLSE
jgi:hypothetical protein